MLLEDHRNGAHPASAGSSDSAHSQQVVTFAIGSQEYGLPVTDVLEVVRRPALLILAGAAAHVRGILNLRGTYLPVLDARLMMGEPLYDDERQQIMIVGRGRPELGLLVDQTHDVHMVQTEPLAAITSTGAPFLKGVMRNAQRSGLLLDLAALCVLTPALSGDLNLS